MDRLLLQQPGIGADPDPLDLVLHPTPRTAMNATLPSESTADVLVQEVAVAPIGPFAHRLPLALRLVHVAIIVNLACQVAYGAFQVFWVLQPAGTFGPMFGHATDLPFEQMITRRMYALETWVAFLGLALYLAITEILPRRKA